MNKSALRCADGLLLHSTEYNFAVLDEHTIVEHRIRGRLVWGSEDIDTQWDGHAKNLLAGPKRLEASA